MSFKSTGPKTRPERMKPIPDPTPATPSARRLSTSSTSSTTSTTSFHSAHDNPYTQPQPSSPSPKHKQQPPQILRFTPSQENLHITSSNTLKTQANTQFSRGDYSSALGTYDKAIAELPVYLEYELAVLQSNVAACHIRLEEWKEAIEAAERGWDGLERLDPTEKPKNKKKEDDKDGEEEEDAVIELPESNDDAADEEMLSKLDLSDQRKGDIRRIRTKLLLRRARARYVLGTSPKPPAGDTKEDKNPFAQAQSLASAGTGGGSNPASTSSSSTWANLSGALADYQMLAQPQFFSILPAPDQKTVRNALAVLPGLSEQAKEKEVAEMMGKLKELGNGILRPFGLSTDMFKMEKDPNSGGMSLRFDGGGGAKKP